MNLPAPSVSDTPPEPFLEGFQLGCRGIGKGKIVAAFCGGSNGGKVGECWVGVNARLVADGQLATSISGNAAIGRPPTFCKSRRTWNGRIEITNAADALFVPLGRKYRGSNGAGIHRLLSCKFCLPVRSRRRIL